MAQSPVASQPQIRIGRTAYRLRPAAGLTPDASLRLQRLRSTVLAHLRQAEVRDLTVAEVATIAAAMEDICGTTSNIPLATYRRLPSAFRSRSCGTRCAWRSVTTTTRLARAMRGVRLRSRRGTSESLFTGTPQYWRHEASWRDVRRCLRMIPVLRAEESLLTAARVAVGSGVMKRADARALQRQWERRTGRPSRRDRPRLIPPRWPRSGLASIKERSPYEDCAASRHAGVDHRHHQTSTDLHCDRWRDVSPAPAGRFGSAPSHAARSAEGRTRPCRVKADPTDRTWRC